MTKDRKIIALTTDPYDNAYGYAFIFIKLFDFIQKNNQDLDVTLISNNGVCSKIVKNEKFIKIKLNSKSHLLLKTLLLAYSFIKKVWSYDIKTVVVANGELPELLSACILKIKFKNTYCFLHDDYEPKFRKYGYLYRAIRKYMLGLIKNIIVINPAYATIFEKDIKNANCYIMPNPILIEQADSGLNDARKTRKKMNIFMIGLPATTKGIDDYYYLANNMSEDKFYWFCNNIDEETYKKYKDKINFRIGLERKEMFKEIQRMDLFCSCSPYESFCLPIGEAIIMNKPIIVYLIKEVKLIYKNFIQYVEYKNRNAMLKALKKFKNGNYMPDIKKAKLFVKENYGLEIISKKLLNILLN